MQMEAPRSNPFASGKLQTRRSLTPRLFRAGHVVVLLLSTSLFAKTPKLDVPQVLSKSGTVQNGTIQLPKLSPDRTYSFLYSIDNPSALSSESRLQLKLTDGAKVLLEKTLHAGDPDFYTSFHVAQAAAPKLQISGSALHARFLLRVNRWPLSPSLKQGSNHRWQDASPMQLGQMVFASSDENEYIPLPGTSRRATVYAQAGEDWYRFQFGGGSPKLVFFQLELTDRDFIPPDVSVFRIVNGQPQEYTTGQDPVTSPHEVQALPANKFTPRILKEPGTYLLRVRANHPAYRLVTRVYDAPPYSDPHQAVRTAVDYIMGAGDSWFANTPRRGGILDRVSSLHQETSLCVGCHVSHFSQRAQLYAAVHGYPVHQRDELKFLSDRFYNNPRPFYGFEKEGVVWSRVISAPANVLSRMSLLMNIYENQVSLEPRPGYHSGAAKYIDLYYSGRHQLPPDETNGNTPLVSTFEVAWYSWKTSQDPQLPSMIAAGEVKNAIDLCYQTQALADIDPAKYKDQIQKNIDRIFSLQRLDGQWSAKFDPQQPEVEFETGHALWALVSAGVSPQDPRMQKGLQYLLRRQQDFGGWLDPLQSFENFRTPFRETQFAILALSACYPLNGRKPGWNSLQPASLAKDPLVALGQMEDIWDRPSPAVTRQIESAAESNDVLIRRAAAESLGRFASASDAPLLTRLLADPSKLVQRSAAWSLREIYTRHEDTSSQYLLSALSSSSARERWGASRVFAHHFSALARRNDLVAALAKDVTDSDVTVRLNAIQGLWQAWFWNADVATRSSIEDTMLSQLGLPQPPWIAENLSAAIYNLADENTRYLYNNWVPLLGQQADRDRAVRGRLAVESQLAGKISNVLETGSNQTKKRLLASLADFPQRRGDVYNLDAELTQPAPLIYSRIGNDIEQISFFGDSADRLSRDLLPLLSSSDPEMRRLAEKASLIIRETNFAAVDKLAGGRGEATHQLQAQLDGLPEAAAVAKAFRLPAPSKGKLKQVVAGIASPDTPFRLDEPYFRAFVEPILHKKGKDGYACADCHATHTIFRANWTTVKNVVNTADPENSLILRKPTSTAESEGITGAKQLAHGGGQRFQKGSPEYETILRWIEGAKLQTAGERSPLN